jgi:hypothetical protein
MDFNGIEIEDSDSEGNHRKNELDSRIFHDAFMPHKNFDYNIYLE